jgi:hypothetical protein
MPRNSSGTYTLPAGNPVVSNTIIETAWGNPTMSDLGSALTDSLSRGGSGSMLAALKLTDGAVGAPGMSFNAEASTGLFRPTSKALGVAVMGQEIARFTDTGLTINKPLSFNDDITLADGKSIIWGDGSLKIVGSSVSDVITVVGSRVSTPVLRANGAVYGTFGVRGGGTTGVYGGAGPGAYNEIVIEDDAAAGISILTPNTASAGITFGDPQNAAIGGVVYDHATDQFSFFAGASSPARMIISPTGVRALVPNWSDNDTAAAPGFAWTQTPAMGMFRAAANIIGWSTTGVEKMRLLAGADGQLVVGGTVPTLPVANRGTIDINGTSSAALMLDVAGVYAGAVLAQVGATYLISNAGGLIFHTLNAEKMRLTAQVGGNAELVVGFNAAQFSATNRGLVEINGAASGSAMVGFDIGGVATDYIVSGTGGFVMSRAGTTGTLTLGFNNVAKLQVTNTVLTDSINGQELGWRDIPQTATQTAMAASSRGWCIPLNANFTVANAMPVNSTVTFVNTLSTALTLTPQAGLTLRLAGTTLTGARTLAPFGFATVWYSTGSIALLMGNVS